MFESQLVVIIPSATRPGSPLARAMTSSVWMLGAAWTVRPANDVSRASAYQRMRSAVMVRRTRGSS